MNITRKKSKMLLATIIFTIINMVLSVVIAISLIFNLFGIVDTLNMILYQISPEQTMDSLLLSYYCELAMAFFVNFVCIRLYLKGYKYGAMGEVFGKRVIMNGIFQLLFSAFVPGILALITGVMLSKVNRVTMTAPQSDNEPYINEIKLAAMSEAVTRLKELRDKGAISEEEYYANIDKILES